MRTFTLLDAAARPYASARPGTLGGHRRTKVYGRLDCAGAARWIAKGHYVQHRVFFADEATALAAGFRPCGSCLRDRYREWKSGRMTVRLDARAPFDPSYVLGFLSSRAVSGVETVDGAVYSRPGFVLRLDDGGGVLTVENDISEGVRVARRLLDLDADPAAIASALGADPVLGPLVALRPGLRAVGGWSRHEVAVRAVVGQQISVAGARTVLGRMAARGLFPSPDGLAEVAPEDLPMPRARARALIAIACGEPLEEVKGVGPWTLAYVRMRMGDPDVFLPTDLVIKRELARRGATVSDAERWRPYRSYAVHHLWASAAAG